MKAGIFVSGLFSLLLAAGCGGTSNGSNQGQAAPSGASAAEKPSSSRIAQKTCPVMGNPINPDISVDYKGRRIYFCCKACVPTFNKNPEKYLKVVDAELKSNK